MDKPIVRSKAGRARDLGDIWFRSKMEKNICRYLKWLKSQGEIADWHYENKRFDFIKWKRRGVTSYKPDFEIIENNGEIKYYEVKGYLDAKSRVKLNCMARYYPDVKVILIDYKQYKLIKKFKRLIPCWEE